MRRPAQSGPAHRSTNTGHANVGSRPAARPVARPDGPVARPGAGRSIPPASRANAVSSRARIIHHARAHPFARHGVSPMYSTSRYRRRAYLYYDPYRSFFDYSFVAFIILMFSQLVLRPVLLQPGL